METNDKEKDLYTVTAEECDGGYCIAITKTFSYNYEIAKKPTELVASLGGGVIAGFFTNFAIKTVIKKLPKFFIDQDENSPNFVKQEIIKIFDKYGTKVVSAISAAVGTSSIHENYKDSHLKQKFIDERNELLEKVDCPTGWSISFNSSHNSYDNTYAVSAVCSSPLRSDCALVLRDICNAKSFVKSIQLDGVSLSKEFEDTYAYFKKCKQAMNCNSEELVSNERSISFSGENYIKHNEESSEL